MTVLDTALDDLALVPVVRTLAELVASQRAVAPARIAGGDSITALVHGPASTSRSRRSPLRQRHTAGWGALDEDAPATVEGLA